MEPMTDLIEAVEDDTTMADLAAADDRPRVSIDQPVNLAQLAEELGVALCGSDTEVVAAESGTVTQGELEMAVAAHVAEPEADPYAAVRAKIALTDPETKAALTAMLDLIAG